MSQRWSEWSSVNHGEFKTENKAWMEGSEQLGKADVAFHILDLPVQSDFISFRWQRPGIKSGATSFYI